MACAPTSGSSSFVVSTFAFFAWRARPVLPSVVSLALLLLLPLGQLRDGQGEKVVLVHRAEREVTLVRVWHHRQLLLLRLIRRICCVPQACVLEFYLLTMFVVDVRLLPICNIRVRLQGHPLDDTRPVIICMLAAGTFSSRPYSP